MTSNGFYLSCMHTTSTDIDKATAAVIHDMMEMGKFIDFK